MGTTCWRAQPRQLSHLLLNREGGPPAPCFTCPHLDTPSPATRLRTPERGARVCTCPGEHCQPPPTSLLLPGAPAPRHSALHCGGLGGSALPGLGPAVGLIKAPEALPAFPVILALGPLPVH